MQTTNGPEGLSIATEVLLDTTAGYGRFWFVVACDDRVVVVIDNAIPIPPTGLEVRTSGLWFEYRCQRNAEHFTVDLEAFGLEVDRGTVVDEATYGHRVPVGCELEWITDTPFEPGSDEGYGLCAQVEGEVLIGSEAFSIAASGFRYHRWGTTAIDTLSPIGADPATAHTDVALTTAEGGIVYFVDDGAGPWWRRDPFGSETLR